MRESTGFGRGLFLAAGLALLSATSVEAQVGILGERFVSLGGDVTVKYISSSAAYWNRLQYFSNGYSSFSGSCAPGDAICYNADGTVDYSATGGVVDLFSNKNYGGLTAASNGEVASLGTIGLGQEVLFGLYVQNENGSQTDPNVSNPLWATQDSDDFTYFSGPQGRNVDNTFHLAVTALGGGTYQFAGGWEDINGGGDQDYNDLVFEVSGVSVTPEPGTIILLGTGLLGLGGVGFMRRRREDEEVEA